MRLLLFPNPSGSHTCSEPEPVGNQSQQGQRHEFLEAAQLHQLPTHGSRDGRHFIIISTALSFPGK